MIAADTSAWLDFSRGIESGCSKRLEAALQAGALVLPMPVLFEILSGPGLTLAAKKFILELPKLETDDSLWERAGDLRRRILQSGLKARSMDCLIAQNCIDHQIGLIAADSDYRHFVREGLILVDS